MQNLIRCFEPGRLLQFMEMLRVLKDFWMVSKKSDFIYFMVGFVVDKKDFVVIVEFQMVILVEFDIFIFTFVFIIKSLSSD